MVSVHILSFSALYKDIESALQFEVKLLCYFFVFIDFLFQICEKTNKQINKNKASSRSNRKIKWSYMPYQCTYTALRPLVSEDAFRHFSLILHGLIKQSDSVIAILSYMSNQRCVFDLLFFCPLSRVMEVLVFVYRCGTHVCVWVCGCACHMCMCHRRTGTYGGQKRVWELKLQAVWIV